MKFIPEEKPTFLSDTSFFVKLLFVVLVGIVIFLLVRMFWKPKSSTTSTSLKKASNLSMSLIHVCIHAYRCTSTPLAQTIFGAFEAATNPHAVHIHIYQELSSQEVGLDAYETYKRYFMDKHTYKMDYLSNIHVKNANASDSGGPLVGFLILAKDLVLNSNYTPTDQCLFLRSFYETRVSTNLYGVTFVQDYDTVIREFPMQKYVYSTSFPRTSTMSDDLLHTVQLQAKNASLTGLLLSNVAIPLMNNKMHGVELTNDNVCTKSSWKHMMEKQAGFTAWSTLDRCMAVPSIYARTKKSSKVPVPFTIFRTYAHTREVRDVSEGSNVPHDVDLIHRVVPIGGICEDMQVMNVQTVKHLVQKALNNPVMIKSIPYHAYTLMLSNLVGPNMYSCNHLAIGVVADHSDQPHENGVETIQHTMAYRPTNWKRVPRLRKQPKHPKKGKKANHTPIVDLVPCNDFDRILPLDPAFQSYADVCAKNITLDAFLGVTKHDNASTLGVKFGMPENFARRRRMLGDV
jgi:hypothetical protein